MRYRYEDFLSVGPGSLAGRFLRKYWRPIFQAAKLKSGRPAPVRVMRISPSIPVTAGPCIWSARAAPIAGWYWRPAMCLVESILKGELTKITDILYNTPKEVAERMQKLLSAAKWRGPPRHPGQGA